MEALPNHNIHQTTFDKLIECKSQLENSNLYTLKGWTVFPWREDGSKMKAPYTPQGFKDATTNPIKLDPNTTDWRVEDIHALIADPLKKNQQKSNVGTST